MAETSKIEWCDSTWNPWIGCTKVGPGCDHCYAERDWDLRRHRVAWGAGQARSRTSVANWRQPKLWNAQPFVQCTVCGWRGELRAADTGNSCPVVTCHGSVAPARRRVFCASLADVFDNEVSPRWRIDLFSLIRSTPDLDYLLLTKRIGNAERMVDEAGGWSGISASGTRNPLPNVWIGATVVNQEEANRDIPKLLATPAAVRFLSIEPMLGPIDLRYWIGSPPAIGATTYRDADGVRRCDLTGSPVEPPDWVIAGGESGPQARPAHPDWFRSLRDQCAAASVPFLFKQWGEWAPGENATSTLTRRTVPAASWWNGGWEIESIRGDAEFDIRDEPTLYRAGKKAAGRLLDGVEHNRFPVAA